MTVIQIKIKSTNRGFARGEFTDVNGEQCSIQESSAAKKPMLWLGQDEPTIHESTGTAMCRMHLSQAHVRALLPLLHEFAKTGRLHNDE